MSTVQGIILAALALAVSTALGDLVSEEVRHRLDALPHTLLRLAARRMPADSHDDHLREWQGELHEILRGAEALPITRFIRGMRYAAGLFRVAPAISAILAGAGSGPGGRRLRPGAGSPARRRALAARVALRLTGLAVRQRLAALTVRQRVAAGGVTAFLVESLAVGTVVSLRGALFIGVVVMVTLLVGAGVKSLSRPPLPERPWRSPASRQPDRIPR